MKCLILERPNVGARQPGFRTQLVCPIGRTGQWMRSGGYLEGGDG